MVTVALFREAALALPSVEEKCHFGQPDFRVANKIFADLSREGDRATLKLTPQTQLQLVELRPDVFSLAPGHWGKAGWTYVVLDAVHAASLRELLLEAWGQVSTKSTAKVSKPGPKELGAAKKKPPRAR